MAIRTADKLKELLAALLVDAGPDFDIDPSEVRELLVDIVESVPSLGLSSTDARNAAAALLVMSGLFEFDSESGVLSTVAGSLPASLARAGSASQRQEWLDRLQASGRPGVASYSSNTIVSADHRGWTYRQTGSNIRRLSIPNASGTGEVADGWDMVASNSSTADQQVAPNGADRINGNPLLTIEPGRSVRLQKVASGVWIIVADTKDETGGAADPPTVVNVSADTAIPATAFGDTYRITGSAPRTATLPDPADVALGWFVRIANGSGAGVSHSVAREGAGQSIEGGNGPLSIPSGETVTIQKVNANEWELIADTAKGTAATGGSLSLSTALTDAQKKAWRAHFGSWHLDVTDNSTLPAVANYNGPDGILLGASGNTGVSFADISDRSTQLTAGAAGDLMLLLSRGWIRVGNLFTGGSAVTAAIEAAKAIADANKAKVDRLTVFESARLTPGGIPDNTLPEFVALELAGKVAPQRIIEVKIFFPSGISAYTLNSGDLLAALNEPRVVDNKSVGPGGVLNITFGSAARNNFNTDFGTAAQFLRVDIHYKFEGTSLAPNVPPDARDYVHFATNNNAFRAPGGLSQSQVDARIAALTRTFTEKAATAGASRTWTYTLDAEDTEIWIAASVTKNAASGYPTMLPRAVITGTAAYWAIDHRNPDDGSATPDNKSVGVRASISGNVLTLNTVGWINNSAPIVYSK